MGWDGVWGLCTTEYGCDRLHQEHSTFVQYCKRESSLPVYTTYNYCYTPDIYNKPGRGLPGPADILKIATGPPPQNGHYQLINA